MLGFGASAWCALTVEPCSGAMGPIWCEVSQLTVESVDTASCSYQIAKFNLVDQPSIKVPFKNRVAVEEFIVKVNAQR